MVENTGAGVNGRTPVVPEPRRLPRDAKGTASPQADQASEALWRACLVNLGIADAECLWEQRSGASRTYRNGDRVFKIRHKSLDARRLEPDRAHCLAREAELLREVRTLPGVVHFIEYSSEAEFDVLVCRYIDAQPLRDRTLTLRQWVAMVWRTGRILVGLARRGIAHNDVATQNLLRSSDGQAHLLDFGRASTGGFAHCLFRNLFRRYGGGGRYASLLVLVEEDLARRLPGPFGRTVELIGLRRDDFHREQMFEGWNAVHECRWAHAMICGLKAVASKPLLPRSWKLLGCSLVKALRRVEGRPCRPSPPAAAATSATRTLSIGLLCPGWPPHAYPNGVVSYTHRLREAMLAQGYRVSLLCRRVEAEARGEPGVVALRDYKVKPSWARRAVRRIEHVLGVEKPRPVRIPAQLLTAVTDLHERGEVDVLDMEESFGWAAAVAPRCPVPVVVRLHGPHFLVGAASGEAGTRAGRRQIRDEGRGIAAASGVTTPSRFVLEQVRARYGLELPEAQVIPTSMAVAEPGRRWSLAACQRDMILFVGRFDRVKGADVMIRAFAELWRGGLRCRLVMAGPAGVLHDDSGRAWTLEEYLATHLPTAARGLVQWVGVQTQNQLNELRRQAMVSVVPSRIETFGCTLVEAMSLGCPVIASAAGALPEIVQDDHNGLLFESGSPEDLAQKLRNLLQNPERAAALGAQALADCQARYAPATISRLTADLYRELIARRTREARHVLT